MTSRTILVWSWQVKIEWPHIAPDKPTQNVFIESFNGGFRAECLNVHWFSSIEEMQAVFDEHLVSY